MESELEALQAIANAIRSMSLTAAILGVAITLAIVGRRR